MPCTSRKCKFSVLPCTSRKCRLSVLSMLTLSLVTARVVSAAVQALPPNTGSSTFATVAGHVQGSDVFWREKCKLIPPDAVFLILDLGSVRDFYKPRAGITFCNMLLAKDRHLWSYDAIKWHTPGYEPNPTCRGGSAMWSKLPVRIKPPNLLPRLEPSVRFDDQFGMPY